MLPEVWLCGLFEEVEQNNLNVRKRDIESEKRSELLSEVNDALHRRTQGPCCRIAYSKEESVIEDHLTVYSLTEQCQYLLSVSCIFGGKARPAQ